MKERRIDLLVIKMSTEFYWDKNEKKLIFTRYAGGIEDVDKDRDLRYVFNSVEDLVKFLTQDGETIIYSEYGIPYTVESMRCEIMRRGVIVLEGEK